MVIGSVPRFFKTQDEFRSWLKSNHAASKELLVGFYKLGSGKPSLTWPESVDQALCFGWIDGVRKSIDQDSYCIRFTPRKPTSIWSAINIAKVQELIKHGQMQDAGLRAYGLRELQKSKIYSYENTQKLLSKDLEAKFKASPSAWAFFEVQAASYKKATTHWVMAAKKADTQLSRLARVIKASAESKRLA